MHLASMMVDEPCCQTVVATLDEESFTGATALEIDPENLKAILKFIVENILPILLRLLFPV